ncbi:MAG: hypothetical protein E7414_03315 [Ruminococcaceae bacterium]|nr:hypothetical protein [Oscillospiraceae bacterium]
MIDFHAHVLSGIDDGPRNIEQSLALLQSQAAQGIDTVIATPHYLSDVSILDFVKSRDAALALLRESLPEDAPRIIPATEVGLFYGMSGVEDISLLCIENTDYMLIEMPHARWSGWEYIELSNLISRRGITPVLAHLDRYVQKIGDFNGIRQLLNMGIPVQINASALLSFSGRGTVKRFLKRHAVMVLGSDCHHPKHRPCRLAAACRAFQKKWGEQELINLQMNAEAILKNHRVEKIL